MADSKLNILLVEDDEVDVMNVRRAFMKMDINNPLYVARNGLEALDLLRGNGEEPNSLPSEHRIILLDINMPKMNGIEFLEELRSDPTLHSIPVIILTTSNEDRDRMNAYRFHVAGYIIKPITFARFTEMIAAFTNYWALCEMA